MATFLPCWVVSKMAIGTKTCKEKEQMRGSCFLALLHCSFLSLESLVYLILSLFTFTGNFFSLLIVSHIDSPRTEPVLLS